MKGILVTEKNFFLSYIITLQNKAKRIISNDTIMSAYIPQITKYKYAT